MTVSIILLALCIAIGLAYIFLIGKFEKVTPQIVRLPEPLKMMGISTRTAQKTVFKDVPKQDKAYEQLKQNAIPNKAKLWKFVAISKDFEGEESWEYLMGDEVTSFQNVPKGLVSFEIPAKTYAVFTIWPKSRFAWGIAMGRMKKYIYTKWIQQSEFEPDNSILGDFELHDKRSEAQKPEIDLYVSVKEKK